MDTSKLQSVTRLLKEAYPETLKRLSSAEELLKKYVSFSGTLESDSDLVRYFFMFIREQEKDDGLRLWAYYEGILHFLKNTEWPESSANHFLRLNPSLQYLKVGEAPADFPLSRGLWAFYYHQEKLQQKSLKPEEALILDLLGEDQVLSLAQFPEILSLHGTGFQFSDQEWMDLVLQNQKEGLII